jgi:hypothetical protein
MVYKDNQPTFNANRNVFNFKDFNQQKEEEKAELKKMKRQLKKADNVNSVNQDGQYKYNKVTHKNDYLVKVEVEDKLDALEEDTSYNEKDDSDDVLRPLALTIEEFSNLREAMYAVKTSASPSAFQAKKFFSNEENFDKVVEKLRSLL